MTEFQFNCKTTANHLIAQANRQHHLNVYQARARQNARASIRLLKQRDREDTLDIAVRVAIAIGIAVATWFLSSIGVA